MASKVADFYEDEVDNAVDSMSSLLEPLIMSILQSLVVYIPLALAGDFLWGYVGIFVAFAVTSVLMGVLGYFWINHEIKKQLGRRVVKAE